MENSAQNFLQEIDELRIRLQEAEETLAAIRAGEVDALVVTDPGGERVFTLAGADRPYRIIVEEMSEAAVTLSLDGTILYCNSRFADLVKYSLERVIGSSFADFVARDHEAIFDGCLTNKEKTKAEMSLRANDGTTVPVYISCTRVTIDNNDAVCLIATDLTEQKRQEAIVAQERRQAEEKLRANERLAAMGTTAAVLAHEIANPLNWIYTTVQLMQLQLAKQEKDLDSSWKAQLQDIHDEIGRLGSLLREFRSLARPLQLQVTAVNTKAFIAEVEKVMAPDLESAAVRTEHHISAELPLLKVDGERLRQVFLNIYKNAIEAMPSGGKLKVEIYPDRQNVIIEITDTGTGIPEDVDIFEPFATTKDKGTGLGLMVVRQILAAHNGSISYRSKRGEGTTFRISLPLSSAPQSPT
jgi:PAS domain S-box-containing protein